MSTPSKGTDQLFLSFLSKIKSSPKSPFFYLEKCLTKLKSVEKNIKAEYYIMETSFFEKKSPSFTNKLSRAKRNFSVTSITPMATIKSPLPRRH
jgi:hypothetical protein